MYSHRLNVENACITLSLFSHDLTSIIYHVSYLLNLPHHLLIHCRKNCINLYYILSSIYLRKTQEIMSIG